MSKKCDICGKCPVTGNNVSHAKNRTKRRWMPNIQSIRIKINGGTSRRNVCTQCIKSGHIVKA